MNKIQFTTGLVAALEKENERRLVLMADLTPGHWFHCHDTATHCNIVHGKAVELGALFANYVDQELLRLAAMAHDWGKIETWRPEGSPWFPGHERKSAEILEHWDPPAPLVSLVANHGRCMQLDQYGDKAVKKLLDTIGSPDDHLAFFLLLMADCAGFSEAGMEAGMKQADLFAVKAGLYITCPLLKSVMCEDIRADGRF
jgi:hypothetical protein